MSWVEPKSCIEIIWSPRCAPFDRKSPKRIFPKKGLRFMLGLPHSTRTQLATGTRIHQHELPGRRATILSSGAATAAVDVDVAFKTETGHLSDGIVIILSHIDIEQYGVQYPVHKTLSSYSEYSVLVLANIRGLWTASANFWNDNSRGTFRCSTRKHTQRVQRTRAPRPLLLRFLRFQRRPHGQCACVGVCSFFM